jgi:UPF0271 protein
VARRDAGAVVADPDDVVARAVRLATEGVVRAVDGTEVSVEARSICIHGDTPGAVALAKAVRQGLDDAGVRLHPFAT